MSAHDEPKVAYLVVCWNNREIIDECLQALQNQTYKNGDIYLIDNASADGSGDYIEKNYPDVKLIKSDANNGFSRGNNILTKEALKDASVKYVALINSDAMLHKDWTKEIVEYLKHKTNVASAQGITLDYFNHDVIDAEHIYVGSNFQSVQYGYGEKYKKAYAHPRRVFGVNAAAALYSREFIEEQPNSVLFDERFFMYLEDVDVAFRALVTGWNSYYVPAAEAYHMGSVSAKKRSNGHYNIYMTFRNQTALLMKNLPFLTLIRFLPEAFNFERHFYKHLSRTLGRDVAVLAFKGRCIGVLRSLLYVGSRVQIQRKRAISRKTLEDVMKKKGLFTS